MKTILLALLLLPTFLMAQPVPDHNYYWFTDTECQFPGIPIPEDPPCDIVRFFGRDTLWGVFRTNGCAPWMASNFGSPITFAPVIMSCDSGEWPDSLEVPDNFIIDAPPIPFPDELSYLRAAANRQGLFLREPGQEWYGSFSDTIVRFYYYPEGTILDTTTALSVTVDLSPRAVIFVDGKLDLRGVLANQDCEVLLGCSRDIILVDNVMLQGTNTMNGSLPVLATSRIAIASEQGIFIGNTWENGRENKTGPPPNNRDICITAYLSAIGTGFQIEQMNDVGDPYMGPSPDERGNIVLTGGITQRYRGYTHRSNNGGTGYNKVYHYDERLRHWRIGVFEPFDPFIEDPIYSDASDPLFPEQFTLAVSPNPFNASTTIRFTLPQASNVRAVAYDVLGREVAKLADASFSAGSHQLSWNAVEQATGVYFLRLETLGQIETRKLMLIK